MSPKAVTARLQAACRGKKQRTGVPMDPASVSARLRTVSELRDLCLALGQGRRIPADEDPQPDTGHK